MQSIFNPAGKKISREELEAEQRKTRKARQRRERVEQEAREAAAKNRRRDG